MTNLLIRDYFVVFKEREGENEFFRISHSLIFLSYLWERCPQQNFNGINGHYNFKENILFKIIFPKLDVVTLLLEVDCGRWYCPRLEYHYFLVDLGWLFPYYCITINILDQILTHTRVTIQCNVTMFSGRPFGYLVSRIWRNNPSELYGIVM